MSLLIIIEKVSFNIRMNIILKFLPVFSEDSIKIKDLKGSLFTW